MLSLNEIISRIKASIPQLEKERKELLLKSRRIYFMGGFMTLAFIVSLFVFFGIDIFIFAAVVGIIAVTALRYFVKDGQRNFRIQFKDKIIETIIKGFNPNLIYKSHSRVKRTDYKQAKLFDKKATIYNGEDYIEGKLGETEFKFSELHSQYEVKTKDGKQNRTIFKGLFLVADFHKYFHSETYILPETALRKVGLHKKSHMGADLIKLEEPEFESKFRVFSTNDTDARYILSPSMMQRIVRLQEKFDNNLSISFRGTNVYIALATGEDFFEHKLNKAVDDTNMIEGHMNDLEDILGIIDDLNLNTRIWSKIPQTLLRNNEEEKS